MKTWIVAFNLPTKKWDSGGVLENYDRDFYDIYKVDAVYREEAEKLAKEQRKRQRLTPPQRAFMEGLFAEFKAGDDPLVFTIQITELDEQRLLAPLVHKGLLSLRSDDPDARIKEVQLTFTGLNCCPRDPAALSAVRRAHQTPPCPISVTSRPRRRP